MPREIIRTDQPPQAIGTYSQGIRVNSTVYLSGQIGLDAQTMTLVSGIEAQVHQVFLNLGAVASAAGGGMPSCASSRSAASASASWPQSDKYRGL